MKHLFAKLTHQSHQNLIHKLLILIMGLMVIIILLSVKVLCADTHMIVVPQYESAKPLKLSSSSFSDLYLKTWGEGLCEHLLTCSPETVEQKIHDTLRLTAASAQGQIKSFLQEEARRIKRDDVSTVFYPTSTRIDKAKKTLIIQGQFHTWFGRDQKPIVQTKTWVLRWQQGNRGVILLKDFYEQKAEER